MRRTLGLFIQGLGVLSFIIFGVWGLLWSLSIVKVVVGTWAVVVGLIFFPFIIGLAPWYALIAWGAWVPLLVIYGGTLTAVLLFTIGSALND